MKQLIALSILRKALILAAMTVGLVFVGFGDSAKTSAKCATNDCCSICDIVWAYCLTHYGHPNDPYKTFAQCVNDLDPDCSDLVCTPGC
jgi:hypothetical protein